MGDSYLPILHHLFTRIRYRSHTTSYTVVLREEQALTHSQLHLGNQRDSYIYYSLYHAPPPKSIYTYPQVAPGASKPSCETREIFIGEQFQRAEKFVESPTTCKKIKGEII